MSYTYTIIIQWSDEDQCYIVSLPEWGEFCHTHGETYSGALTHAEEVLALLIASAVRQGESLPEPNVFGTSLQIA